MIMRAVDLSVGDSFPIGDDRLGVVTDIEDSVIHNTSYDKPKRTITFDLYTTGLFPVRIGWSFYVFFDVTIDMSVFQHQDSCLEYDDDE